MLEKFRKYHIIWEKERDEEIAEFMKQDPRLSDFEGQIVYYEELEAEIMAEAEYYNVEPIALFTGQWAAVIFCSIIYNLTLDVGKIVKFSI